MNKPIKILLLCLCSATIFFGAVIGISHVPKRIQKEFSGIEILMKGANELEILQNINIRIDGRLYDGWFLDNLRFKGLIEIGEYPFTFRNEIDMLFSYDDYTSGILVYPAANDNGMLKSYVLGTIYTNKNFSSFVIDLYEFNENYGGNLIGGRSNRVIAAPASDVREALEIFYSNAIFWSSDEGIIQNPPK